MAITLQDDEPAIHEKLTKGPGSRLREARVTKKLEVEDVASRLRLHVKIIRRIEADDYEHLPAPTFVRGYLRGYARLVDLPADEIVDSYDQNDFSPPPLVPDISSREETKSSDFPVRLTTYAVIGILFVLVVLWWQSGGDTTSSTLNVPNESSAIDGRASTEPEVDLGASELNTPDETDEAELGSEPLDALPATALTENIVEIEGAQPEPDAQLPPTTAEPTAQQVAAEPIVATLPEASTETVLDNAVSTASPSVSASGQPLPRESPARAVPARTTTPGEGDTLSLTLARESWLEIYNRDGERLFYDLARADTTINLTDTGPFRLIIGYASGAILRYNGELVDVSPYTFAGVAKLSLGETEPFAAQ